MVSLISSSRARIYMKSFKMESAKSSNLRNSSSMGFSFSALPIYNSSGIIKNFALAHNAPIRQQYYSYQYRVAIQRNFGGIKFQGINITIHTSNALK